MEPVFGKNHAMKAMIAESEKDAQFRQNLAPFAGNPTSNFVSRLFNRATKVFEAASKRTFIHTKSRSDG